MEQSSLKYNPLLGILQTFLPAYFLVCLLIFFSFVILKVLISELKKICVESYMASFLQLNTSSPYNLHPKDATFYSSYECSFL